MFGSQQKIREVESRKNFGKVESITELVMIYPRRCTERGLEIFEDSIKSFSFSKSVNEQNQALLDNESILQELSELVINSMVTGSRRNPKRRGT